MKFILFIINQAHAIAYVPTEAVEKSSLDHYLTTWNLLQFENIVMILLIAILIRPLFWKQSDRAKEKYRHYAIGILLFTLIITLSFKVFAQL